MFRDEGEGGEEAKVPWINASAVNKGAKSVLPSPSCWRSCDGA